MDYIEVNLSDDLALAQLAQVAQFSPYHFHRIFLATTGETLNTFINRVRLERAAALLLQRPDRQVTEVAYECGFASPSSFARSFKEHYELTPTKWRAEERVPATLRRHLKQQARYEVSHVAQGWEVAGFKDEAISVRLQQEPSSEVAYVRYVGPFQGSAQVFSELFDRLYSWATPLGFIDERATVSAVYHDNPSLTEDDKLRVSACVTVPEDTQSSGEVGRMCLTGGLYAIGTFALTASEYQDAWNMMWSGWLPESGYEPADGLVFERFLNPLHVEEQVGVEICIPVRPLRGY